MVLSLACGALLLPACGNTATNTMNTVYESSPPEGVRTGVETAVGVRPDALGTSATLALGTGGDDAGGAMISGELVSADGTWIVLDDEGTRRWIRLDNVVWVRQAAPPPGSAGPASGDQAG
jgi:hypothetical protein